MKIFFRLRYALPVLFFALASGAQAQALPKGIQELKGVSAALTDEDLEVLAPLFKSAQILAIGESAHGSAGYAQAQHRLVKILVEKYGYRKIMLELVSQDQRLNEYLQTCQGNLKDILYRNPWNDHNAARKEFYEWLCAYNQAHPNDKVTVHSVDPNPWVSAPRIRALTTLAGIEKTYSDPIEANCFGATAKDQVDWAFSKECSDYYTKKALDETKHQNCLAALDDLSAFLGTNQGKILRLKSTGKTRSQLKEMYFDTLDAVRSLHSWQMKSYSLFADEKASMAYREAAFGPSVLWHWKKLDRKPKKAILIAHNLHVAKKALLPTEAGDPWEGLVTVGTQLEKALGRGYRVIAQSGYDIAATYSKGSYPLPNASDSIDFYLKSLQKPFLLLDTHASWIKKKSLWHVHEESVPNGRQYPIRKAFDAIFYHSVSPASVFWGKP
ncbi:MAG: erythromycin esterase family protein [Bdellovibrionales bacterium]|nr:erythromycin esterase family protein [Bdellovibrionales bacterium]